MDLNKDELLKRQTELSAYNLREEKYTFQLPAPGKVFIGRERELEAMDKIFTEKNLLCLVGNGGMGKTQLAAEYVHRSKHPAVIWLHGENKLLIFQIQVYLEKAHKIDLTKEKDQTVLLKKFYDIIGKNSLVVIDNVEDKESIQEFLPKNSPVKVIITSRYRGWECPIIEVPQFSKAETFRYISQNCQESEKEISAVGLEELNRLLDGVPLAISQAVACMRQDSDMTLEKYCDSFKKEMEMASFERDSDDGLNQVYVTFILALHKVRNVNNQIDLLMNVIGYMAPDELNKHMAVSFLEARDPKNFSKTKSKKMKQIFRVLTDYSILSQSSKDENIYSINRLTQSVIRMIHKRNGVFEKNFDGFAEWICESLPLKVLSDSNIKEFTPHILVLCDMDQPQLQSDTAHKFLILMSDFGSFYTKRGNYVGSEICFEVSQQISKNKFGENALITTVQNILLGSVHGLTGNYEKRMTILEANAKSLKDSKQYDTEAQNLVSLGIAHFDNGKYNESLSMYEKALAIYEKNCPGDLLKKNSVLKYMANTYGMLGQHERHRDMLLDAIQIDEEFYGEDNPEIAKTLTNLAGAYYSLGETLKQKNTLERALRIQENYYEGGNRDIAITLQGLATAYGDLSDFKKKHELLQRAVKIFEKLYGPTHIESAQVRVKLGNSYGQLGDHKKKIEILEAVVPIIEKHYGKNGYHLGLAVGNLGTAYLDSGLDLERAIKLLEQSVQIIANSNMTKMCCVFEKNLAIARGRLNSKSSSGSLKRNASNEFIINQLKLATELENEGIRYLNENKSEKALEVLKKSLEIREMYLGREDKSNTSVLNNLAIAYGRLGNNASLSTKNILAKKV